MRALSIRQPWAWAILHAGKRVENRDWRAAPRSMIGQTFLIHAAKGCTREDYADAAMFMLDGRLAGCEENIHEPPAGRPTLPTLAKLTRGAIVGRARLVRAEPNGATPRDPWAIPGAMGLVLSEVEEISWPVPFKGALGFFEAPDELLAGRSWVRVSP